MDEFLRDIHASLFEKWIILRNDYNWKKTDTKLTFEDEVLSSTISFHNDSIIEMEVLNKTLEKNVFYLHFQMNSLNHAINLYYELIHAIKKLMKQSSLKVLLSCSGGLTTSLFAYQLNQAVETLGLDFKFEAVCLSDLLHQGEAYDVIMLAPQISYEYAKISNTFRHQLVLNIPPDIFAMYDVYKCINFIKQEIDHYRKRDRRPIDLPIQKAIHSDQTILTIGVIRHIDEVRLVFRIYKNNDILLNNEIIKQIISINDIIDIIATTKLSYEIDIIGVAVPGIINHGITESRYDGLKHNNIKDLLLQRFNIPTIIINDANAMAVGQYITQNEYENIVFYFQPRGHTRPGAGIIINGKLHHGYKNLSGEMQFVLNEEDIQKNISTKGSIELVDKGLRTIISTIAPDLIIFYCDLIPDTNALIQEVSKRVPVDFIPKIKKANHLKDYMLLGIMAICAK